GETQPPGFSSVDTPPSNTARGNNTNTPSLIITRELPINQSNTNPPPRKTPHSHQPHKTLHIYFTSIVIHSDIQTSQTHQLRQPGQSL
ncbi:hypothetical protein C7212DRAFT_333814, partial [Tuber magnatum]